MEHHELSTRSSFLDAVPPRTAIGLGAALAVGAIGIVGFLILLPGAIRGTAPSRATSNPTPTATAPTPAPSPAPPPQPFPDETAGTFRPIDPSTDHLRGSADASVKIIEYSDLECPFCKRFHPTMQQVMAEYGDRVAWVYRHFPLRSLHAKAAKEAEATECANELGGNDAFWTYVDRLFEVTPSNDGLAESQLPQIAQDIGLDRSTFETCLNSGKYAQHVTDDENDAIASGGRGTPWSIILGPNGQQLPIGGALPFESVKPMIDSVLK